MADRDTSIFGLAPSLQVCVCAMRLFVSTFARESRDSVEVHMEVHLQKLLEETRDCRTFFEAELGALEILVSDLIS